MKKMLGAFCLGFAISGALGSFVIKEEDKKFARLFKKAKLTHTILMEFVDRTDGALVEEIMDKYQFDAITLEY